MKKYAVHWLSKLVQKEITDRNKSIHRKLEQLGKKISFNDTASRV